MNSIYKKTTLLLLVVFALSITGCLSNNTSKFNVGGTKLPSIVTNGGNTTTDPDTSTTDPVVKTETQPQKVYDPAGNKKPVVKSPVLFSCCSTPIDRIT